MKDYSPILLLIGLSLIITKASYSQMTIDSGKDTTYCVGLYPDTMFLGSNVIIQNGIEPYSVMWKCKVPKGLYSFYMASDLLNDTTVLSPYFKSWPISGEWIKFIVHVADKEKNYAEDSINIRFSTFVYTTGYFVVEVKEGDSIQFRNTSIGGGIQPLKFFWQPKTGLSNPDSLVTWCRPDSSIQYNIVAVDSCGCISSPNLVYDVRVLKTGFNRLSLNKDKPLTIKQHGKRIYFDNPLKQKAHIVLYSIDGGAKYNFTVADDNFEIAPLIKEEGIYIVTVSLGDKTGSCKFINQ